VVVVLSLEEGKKGVKLLLRKMIRQQRKMTKLKRLARKSLKILKK
jgi:hypothetical protein